MPDESESLPPVTSQTNSSEENSAENLEGFTPENIPPIKPRKDLKERELDIRQSQESTRSRSALAD